MIDRPAIIEGRPADLDAVDELTIGEGLAQLLHLGGRRPSALRLVSAPPTSSRQTPRWPSGPHVTFRIVGIVRRPLDLGGRGAAGGVIVPTPAFLPGTATRSGRSRARCCGSAPSTETPTSTGSPTRRAGIFGRRDVRVHQPQHRRAGGAERDRRDDRRGSTSPRPIARAHRAGRHRHRALARDRARRRATS